MSLFDFEERPEDQEAAVEAMHAANIARTVFQRRLDEGLSQGELAKIARTTQARVSEIEALKGDPKLSTLGRVAYALGCMVALLPIPAATTSPTPHGYRTLRSQDLTTTAVGSGSQAWRPTTTVFALEQNYG